MSVQLDPAAAREFGYRVVDMLVEQLAGLADDEAVRRATRPDMEALLREPAPDTGRDPAEVLRRVRDDVFGNFMCLNHPRFFGWVPGPTNFVSVMAESITAAMNPFMGSWLVSAGPSQVELVTVDWLREMLGLPPAAGGLFTSGGSMANLTALATARHVKLDDDMRSARVYCSTETHSSVERALRVLGFPAESLRTLPADDDLRFPASTMRQTVEADRAAGLRPFCAVATAGSTNTGAVDPLGAIADVCAAERLWFHVDGAYGAPAMLVPATRGSFAGIERADSVTLDPHKWLFQPYEIGCVIVRDGGLLRETFTVFRDYMRDAVGEDDEINFRDHGVQLTRSFRALKLWMSIQIFGLAAFRDAIAHGIGLAEHAEARLRAAGGWEIVTPAQLGLITFRPTPHGHGEPDDDASMDVVTEGVGRRMYDDGYAVMSGTRVGGRPVLRLCTINPRTTPGEIDAVIERLEKFVTAERAAARGRTT